MDLGVVVPERRTLEFGKPLPDRRGRNMPRVARLAAHSKGPVAAIEGDIKAKRGNHSEVAP
jgi:hypothetical protein